MTNTISNIVAMTGILMGLLSLIFIHTDQTGVAATMALLGTFLVALVYAVDEPII